MYPMRSPKILIRLGVSLVLSAGCIAPWMVATSHASPRSAAVADSAPPTAAEAARFLQQSTWGPNSHLISHVQNVGFSQFLDEQFAEPISSYPTLPLVDNKAPDDCKANTVCRRDNYTLYPVQTHFFIDALYGGDQLRQRLAFALHQILVVSGLDIGQ